MGEEVPYEQGLTLSIPSTAVSQSIPPIPGFTEENAVVAGWCVVLLKRYLGIVWGPGYPREQVGALRPPIVPKGRPGRPSSNPRINLGQPS